MLADVRLQAGDTYAACAFDDRRAAEWPPHPARLFYAMAAAWGGAGCPDAEKQALEWLERRDPPAVCVPEGAGAGAVVTHYVPGNKHPTNGQRRLCSERTFPETHVPGGLFQFVWDEDPPARVLGALEGLVRRVCWLGHSSSMVVCRVRPGAEPAPGLAKLVPSEAGEHRLRVPGEGLLGWLAAYHKARENGAGREPLAHNMARYGEPRPDGAPEPARPATAGDWTVFRFGAGPKAHVSRAAAIADAAKGTLLSHMPAGCPASIKALIAGHAPDGSPVRDAHPLFWPLPFVGSPRADGMVKGVAVCVPDRTPEAETVRLRVNDAAQEWDRSGKPLTLPGGRALNARLCNPTDPTLPRALRQGRWSGGPRGARSWVTAAPIALHNDPGPLGSADSAARGRAERTARDLVVESLVDHLGLPEGAQVEISLDRFADGTRPAKGHPAFRQGGRSRRLVHARVVFPEPVSGPLAVGTGRYLGLGLMAPTRAGRLSHPANK